MMLGILQPSTRPWRQLAVYWPGRLVIGFLFPIEFKHNHRPEGGLQTYEHQQEDQEEEEGAGDAVHDGGGDGVGDHV